MGDVLAIFMTSYKVVGFQMTARSTKYPEKGSTFVFHTEDAAGWLEAIKTTARSSSAQTIADMLLAELDACRLYQLAEQRTSRSSEMKVNEHSGQRALGSGS